MLERIEELSYNILIQRYFGSLSRENQPKTNQANGILYSGFKYALEKYSIWLEFILDDFQIDRNIQEPTTYGVLFGIEINKPIRMVDDL